MKAGVVVAVAGRVVGEGLAVAESVAVASGASVDADDPPQATSTASSIVTTAIQ